jgi:hypothetical protein
VSPLPQLLTAGEVAEILGITRAEVYPLKDAIGWVSIGRRVRFHPEAVFAYIERCRHPSASESPPVSSAGKTPRSSGPSTRPRAAVARSANPQVAEMMARLARGSRPVN